MAPRILIVDDEPSILATMAPLLRTRNYDVSTATTVTATFSESVQSGTISFILKDSVGNAVAATITYTDANHTATLTLNVADGTAATST